MEIKLTSKEKLVLYGLSRYPGQSDIDLSSLIDVDRSTIFKSKRKFRDWQLIRLLNVPSCGALGAEMLSMVFMRFSPRIDGRESLTEWMEMPDCVLCAATNTDAFSLVYSKNMTEFKRRSERILNSYQLNGVLKDYRCVHCSVELTEYHYNVSAAINEMFDLGRSDIPRESIPLKPSDVVRFSEKDRLTLYAFVKYPSLSDLELSKRTGISRPTISGKRVKFFESNILNREVYIEWQKICGELLCFYHLRMKRLDEEVLRDIGELLRNIGFHLLYYLQPGDVCGVMLSPSYTHLKGCLDALVHDALEMDLLCEDPYTMIMPLRTMALKKLDYAPVTAEMLGIKKEL